MHADVRPARSGRRAAAWLAAPAAVVLAALTLTGSAAAATPAPTGASPYFPTQGPGATTQGIIMRDGGVCDPIRHMGC